MIILVYHKARYREHRTCPFHFGVRISLKCLIHRRRLIALVLREVFKNLAMYDDCGATNCKLLLYLYDSPYHKKTFLVGDDGCEI